jgi:uncharacterized protein
VKSHLRCAQFALPAVLLALLFAAGSGCTRRAAPNESRTAVINVRGQGSASTLPDKIEWRLLIHGDAPSVATAHDRVLAADADLMARAKELGIPEGDFKLQDLRQGADWRWVNGQREPANTYFSDLSVALTITDASKYPAVAEKLFVDNAIFVEGVAFKSSKSEDLQRQALAAAITNAKEQAAFAARKFGVTLGGLRNVNIMGPLQPIYDSARIVGALQLHAQVLPSLKPITVTASVDAAFELK